MTLLDCQHISKSYGKQQVLHDISFTIEQGDIVGFVGPNGAGKSTLIKVLTGLVWPDAGNVTIDGINVHKHHVQAMQHVGAIIEWPYFIPYLDARKNLQMICGNTSADFNKKMNEVIDFVGLGYVKNKKVGNFSTGMKQRLGIALTLLPESTFIILDEPANGLDPSGIIEVRDLIAKHNREKGTTVMMSSHLLKEVETVCDKVLVLNHGKLLAAGKLKDLLNENQTWQIIISPHEKALAILEQAKQASSNPITDYQANAPAPYFNISAASDAGATINSFLVNKGLHVSHISLKTKTLEDLFNDLMAAQAQNTSQGAT